MIIESDLTNVYRSVYKFLTETTYTKSSVTQTLLQRYTGLKIISEYPQDLTKLAVPSLALMSPEEQSLSDPYFGDGTGYRYDFSLYGFAGGNADDADNILQRDEMRNDLKRLIEGSYISMYSFPDLTLLGNMESVDIVSRHIPPTSTAIVAERFKFVIDFAVEMIES